MNAELSAIELSIKEREDFIATKGKQKKQLRCDAESIAGCVSQRACVFCGARVVLNPITDAIHLIHGPIGCASYTWDIRGSLSSGTELYRNSFSTDLKEQDVIFGGEKKLARAIDELVAAYHAKLIFVYSTCIVGVIGDDIEAVCRAAMVRHHIKVIPVQSSGFIGNKSAGYRAACDSLLSLIHTEKKISKKPKSVNYLGDFNLAGEAWIIRDYLARIGVTVSTVFTGDASYEELKTAPAASLNIIQCAGSMAYLAKQMEELYHIPYLRISFLGIEDTAVTLRNIAEYFEDPEMQQKVEILIEEESRKVTDELSFYRKKLEGKKAAVYVGGGFKAISLIKQFREIGMEVVMVGTQTGQPDDYDTINGLVTEGTVVLDDANPAELEKFMIEQGANLLVGGVKERPLAYKLGVAFVDHNHERKHPLSGFVGAVNFAREVYSTVCSPVWRSIQMKTPWGE
ncbi:MAG: nitrogenase iron-molybdenum cofactor biosynthesis protein NifE [Pelosinus sp.]|nr:nitrogenase iron-molybdenum cofactor biosynthesis protein NifE [Pelosinus sp.]